MHESCEENQQFPAGQPARPSAGATPGHVWKAKPKLDSKGEELGIGKQRQKGFARDLAGHSPNVYDPPKHEKLHPVVRTGFFADYNQPTRWLRRLALLPALPEPARAGVDR